MPTNNGKDIITNNIKILTRLIDTPENRALCFDALKQSIDDFSAGRSFSDKSRLIANKFMFSIIGEKYDSWFKPMDTDGSVEQFLTSPAQRQYLRKLVDWAGRDYYLDELFYERFRDAINRMKQENKPVSSLVDIPNLRPNAVDSASDYSTGINTPSAEENAAQGNLSEIIAAPDTAADDADDEEITFDDNDSDNIASVDISMQVASVVQRIKAVCESCFQLDKSQGLMVTDGKYSIELAGSTLRQTHKKSDLIRVIYATVMSCLAPQKIKMTPSPRTPITPENLDKGFDYYPGMAVGYALGIVNNRKYSNWNDFEKALQEHLTGIFMDYADKGVLSEYSEKLICALSTMMVILMYNEGVGIRFRLSLPGYEFNTAKFTAALKRSPVFSNATIVINNIANNTDTFDIQVMQDMKKYLSDPTWGYQVFEAYQRNGRKPDIFKGIPIGRKLNGEIVEFKLDPSEKFINFLAAGSGAGKGVLTLSILAACLGNGIPVFYVDYKPDMAEVFWNMSQKLGVTTFSFDGGTDVHPILGRKATESVPAEVYDEFGGTANTLIYLKCLQWALILAKYRATNNTTDPFLFFVFDECEAAQANVVSVLEAVNRVIKNPEHKPQSKNDPGDAAYRYAVKLGSWISKLDVDLSEFIKATARKSAVLSLFIAQSTLTDNWRTAKFNSQEISIFGQILRAGTVFKFLGKGTGGMYGSDAAEITAEERSCINNYRFFMQAKGAKPKTAEVFKTFLTLNSDNPDDNCWKKGIGHGDWQASDGNFEEYAQRLARKYPGHGQFTNDYGMHTGTGFEGLAAMYCNGDTKIIADALSLSWTYSNDMLKTLGMDASYSTVADYIYDLSPNGLFTVANAMDYTRYLSTLPTESDDADDSDEFSLGGDILMDDISIEGNDDFMNGSNDDFITDDFTFDTPDTDDAGIDTYSGSTPDDADEVIDFSSDITDDILSDAGLDDIFSKDSLETPGDLPDDIFTEADILPTIDADEPAESDIDDIETAAGDIYEDYITDDTGTAGAQAAQPAQDNMAYTDAFTKIMQEQQQQQAAMFEQLQNTIAQQAAMLEQSRQAMEQQQQIMSDMMQEIQELKKQRGQM